jgi:lipopolysaccharide/colanic/teichoic acid biosynthesis glycosyltransferase
MVTRTLDLIISAFGLICLAPMLPWIALLIKLDSKGPVFFACPRVGRGGKIFKMYKFRTMYETPINIGASVSPQGDPRVTPAGRILRRLKINEFPQFFNVLTGDMTLIGPRPEAPDLAALYPDYAQAIFSVKPGLAGPNQIMGRNEEELYPPGVDPVKYYIEHILPHKLPLDLEYIQDPSIFKNLRYLYLSVKVTISGAINRQHLIDNKSQIYLMLADAGLCLCSFYLAHYLRYETFKTPLGTVISPLAILPWVVLLRLPIFAYLGFYHTLIRHISFFDLKMVMKGVAISSLVLTGFAFFMGFTIYGKYPRGVFIMDWAILTTCLVGYRVLLKKLYLYYKRPLNSMMNRKRVAIWGAGDAGELCLLYLKKDKHAFYEVAGFIDDAPLKRNRRLNGVKILGNRYHLPILAKLYKFQEVFIAMPSASETELKQALNICHNLGLEPKLFQLQALDFPPTDIRTMPEFMADGSDIPIQGLTTKSC